MGYQRALGLPTAIATITAILVLAALSAGSSVPHGMLCDVLTLGVVEWAAGSAWLVTICVGRPPSRNELDVLREWLSVGASNRRTG